MPASASVIVVARPQELAEDSSFRAVLHAIVSDAELERYRQHTGIDPRGIEELVWAESDEGALLAIRSSEGSSGGGASSDRPSVDGFSAPMAVAEMGERMLPVESRSDEPFVRRVGHYQGARRDLVALSDRVLVVVTGRPELARSTIERALGAPGEPPAPLASAVADHGAAPLLVVAPRPLGLPPGTPVALLLARERALVVAARSSDTEGIALLAELQGEFPPGAETNFRALAEVVARSDLGLALGMADALPTLRVDAAPEQVMFRATFPAAALASGLRVLFAAEIAELLGSSPSP